MTERDMTNTYKHLNPKTSKVYENNLHISIHKVPTVITCQNTLSGSDATFRRSWLARMVQVKRSKSNTYVLLPYALESVAIWRLTNMSS